MWVKSRPGPDLITYKGCGSGQALIQTPSGLTVVVEARPLPLEMKQKP